LFQKLVVSGLAEYLGVSEYMNYFILLCLVQSLYALKNNNLDADGTEPIKVALPASVIILIAAGCILLLGLFFLGLQFYLYRRKTIKAVNSLPAAHQQTLAGFNNVPLQ
jgi:hypothetical protein